jgi:hypothetical protein
MKNDEGNPIHGVWQNLTILAKFQEFRIICFASHTVTQAPTPSTVTPRGHTRGNTPFPPRYEILFSNLRRGSNVTRYLLLY